MAEDDFSELHLRGYTPLADHGFALPLFAQAEGQNVWYKAICSISGDREGHIADFQPIEPTELIELPAALQRPVFIGGPWQDVFRWGGQVYVGTVAELWTGLEPLMAEISDTAPLSALDLHPSWAIPELYHSCRTAHDYVDDRFGAAKARRWRNGIFLRDVVRRRIARHIGRELSDREDGVLDDTVAQYLQLSPADCRLQPGDAPLPVQGDFLVLSDVGQPGIRARLEFLVSVIAGAGYRATIFGAEAESVWPQKTPRDHDIVFFLVEEHRPRWFKSSDWWSQRFLHFAYATSPPPLARVALRRLPATRGRRGDLFLLHDGRVSPADIPAWLRATIASRVLSLGERDESDWRWLARRLLYQARKQAEPAGADLATQAWEQQFVAEVDQEVDEICGIEFGSAASKRPFFDRLRDIVAEHALEPSATGPLFRRA